MDNTALFSDTIQRHQSGVSALLYIADFNMPNTRSINQRRREISKWVLRQSGIETGLDQLNRSNQEADFNQVVRAYEKQTKELDKLRKKLQQSDGKTKTVNEATEKEAQEIEQWLSENKANYEQCDLWLQERKKLLNSINDLLKKSVTRAAQHTDFLNCLRRSKSETPDSLGDMLATAGSILVFGTPETLDKNTFWVSNEERALVREMQSEWSLKNDTN